VLGLTASEPAVPVVVASVTGTPVPPVVALLTVPAVGAALFGT